MKTITKEELKEILENHLHWLREDCNGWENMKADLSNTDLRSANLRSADLRCADLRCADLSSADLSCADLSSADLSCADLRSANLRSADLRCADLSSANLRSADLRCADLSSADLRSADLRCADLSSADLRCADLSSADLSCADLRYAKNVPFVPYACPDFGMFIGFKKAYFSCEQYIVVLEIPEDAKRLSATGRKCRCNKAKVLEIQNIDGSKADVEFVCSQYDSSFRYKVGETVSVDDFCEDRWNECSQGVHFFINRQEAVDY